MHDPVIPDILTREKRVTFLRRALLTRRVGHGNDRAFCSALRFCLLNYPRRHAILRLPEIKQKGI